MLQRREQECYAPVIQVLKFLVNPNIKEGTGLVLAQQGGLPAEAAQEAKAVILKVSPMSAICHHVVCIQSYSVICTRQTPLHYKRFCWDGIC